ncbi:BfmA/BtgA family mobilization protein [Galbibacter sp. PAP.153]|uniref:BfmA/BtgA family mobilization protein n=1 Tax=Galbibacter sp. PAP.153 TaxID=3104623 RepID=UPI00300B56FD
MPVNREFFTVKMEDAYKKYRFSAISIKKETADRFRKFSREISGSHSKTLETMLNFFKWNGLSPNDNVGVKTDTTKKRINALIAIVRNIEKEQTLPIKAMLDILFQEASQMENPDGNKEEEVGFDFGSPAIFNRDTELEHYQNRYGEMQWQLSQYKNKIQELLERLTYIKGTFGKGYYKLDMDYNELENFKKELDYVHHHHPTKS